MQKTHNTAFLGLGGNIGNPRASMAAAIEMLKQHPAIRVTAISSLYRTKPQGLADQPDFLNAAIRIETELAPLVLLDACLSVEQRLKRVRKERWGPHIIDIDLLIYDNVTVKNARLELPHPRLMQRAFVLVPLNEIAPDFTIDGISVQDLVRATKGQGITVYSRGDSWARR